MANRNKKKSKPKAAAQVEATADSVIVPSRSHEVLAVAAFIIGLIVLLALITYDGLNDQDGPIVTENLIGPVGAWLAYLLYTTFGAAAYMVDLAIWLFGGFLFVGRANRITIRGVVGALVIALLSAVAIHTMLTPTLLAGGHDPGGLVGTVLGGMLNDTVSTAGTYIVALGGIILTLILVTDISMFLLFRALWYMTADLALAGADFSMRVVNAWKTSLPEDSMIGDGGAKRDDADMTITGNAEDRFQKTAKKAALAVTPAGEASAPDGESTPATAKSAPKIVTQTPKSKTDKGDQGDMPAINQQIEGKFVTPPLSLLERAPQVSINVDEAYLNLTAERLMDVLADFGIQGDVREIHPGPVVTMFEFQPKSGTKLSRIEGLSNEVAMALEVTRVRIVAPIPGKNAVGFELPNKEREIVRLREVFEDESFAGTKAKLPMALGKDIAGIPFCVDLAKMPHLLMAGTTGSGKSVSVNTMLLSLLYKHTPEDLRLLLIDPKMIEFQPFNHIPHLLLPVVTDMSLACLALKWGVDEMERRYQLFADMGSKNLASYNTKVKKILAEAKAREENPVSAETAISADGSVVEFGEEPQLQPKKLPEKLPLIVICIDELADLMMVAAKDVENSIARLAQKARASGIHLIVATQRPSTDVVTGLIKANFPARLSCQVSSGIDSRTILGTNGAEHLLGNGDMLVLPPGSSDLRRVQGAFVSEEEVVRVVDFLKQQGLPQYDEDIVKPRDGEGGDDVDDDEKDEMYDQAVSIVAEAQSCSISMLQRKLRIGYNRSARIVEIMEKEGVVGPSNGQNKREVLISPQ